MIYFKNYGICFLLFFFLLASCRSPSEPEPLRSPELTGPIVTGLVFTDESGNQLGIWGDPSLPEGPLSDSNNDEQLTKNSGIDDDDENRLFNIHNPYPNPNSGFFMIEFYISKKMNLKIWAVPASYCYSFKGNNYGTSVIKTPQGLSIKTIFNGELIKKGIHRISWDGIDDNNTIIPNGFYRIYIEFDDDELLWRDVLIVSSNREISPEFKVFLKPFWDKYLAGPYPFN